MAAISQRVCHALYRYVFIFFRTIRSNLHRLWNNLLHNRSFIVENDVRVRVIVEWE